VDAEPGAREELRRLGVPLVPAVAVGDRVVHGWNPAAAAALLGVEYRAAAALPPAELARRLDTILEAAEGLMRAIPAAQAGVRPPERDRSVKDLGFHVFRLALAFAEAVDAGQLPEAWLQETAPPAITDGAGVAAYGAEVRRRLRRWFAGRGPETYGRVIDVYYGPQPAHDLLERTAWHAAQHLRQLYALAERLGVRPPAPLPDHALRGLPLPAALW